jgi:hypothetical protein
MNIEFEIENKLEILVDFVLKTFNYCFTSLLKLKQSKDIESTSIV